MAASVVIGQISFSPGFSDGFETQNRLLLSAIYNIKNSSVIEGAGISVSSAPLSSYYNLNNVTVKGFANIPVSVTNLTFNLNNVNIVGDANVSTDKLSASYNLNDPSISISSLNTVSAVNGYYEIHSPDILVNGGITILIDLMNATYSFKDSSIKGNSLFVPNLVTAQYNENTVNIVEGSGSTNSASTLNSNFNLQDVNIHASVKNAENILSASYNLNDVTVKSINRISADSLTTSYILQDPSLKVSSKLDVNKLTISYTLEDANFFAVINYNFSADTLSASWNINNPEVIIAIPDWLNDAQVPWNSHWRDDTECKDNERELYSTLITDTYNKFACVWIYYPTSYNITYDRVFKEDQNKYVIRAFSAMGFVEDIPAEHKSYNLEGIIGLDIVRAYFSIAHFTEASTYSGISSGIYGSYSPTVGDICYLTSNSAFYEVINVKNTVEQFMNRPNNYEVTMRVFKDNKMTVSATIPFTDPIYTVCSSAASATEQFHDYLAINSDVSVLISAIEYKPKPGEKIQDAFNGW